MNGVLGMCELLKDTSLDRHQTEFVGRLSDAGETLLAIINDILDLSKIEAGKLQLADIEFDLRDQVEETVRLVAEQASSKGLELACLLPLDVPAQVCGDPIRLRQILLNLLSNAVKFTERGGVQLRASYTEDNSRGIRLAFEVEDTGIGIPESQRAQIFENFAQVDDTDTRRFGGTGLGLAIVRQLVTLMDGSITVTSEPGKGSTFRFDICLQRSPSADQVAMGTPLCDQEILVIAQPSFLLHTLVHYLEHGGAKVDHCLAVDHVMAILEASKGQACHHTAVILDVRLADEDGRQPQQLLEKLATLAEFDRLVVLHAGHRAPAAELKRWSNVVFVQKPFRLAELYDALCECPSSVTATPSSWVEVTDIAKTRLGIRALLVEDNPVNVSVATGMLSRLGCEVVVAADGEEAVELFDGDPSFDIILMDCQMPRMNGLDATKLIRAAEPAGQRVPVLALTANALEGSREACLEAGMDAMLSKPFRRQALRQAIAELLPDLPAGGRSDAGNGYAEANISDFDLDLEVIDEIRALDEDGTDSFLREMIETFFTYGDTAMHSLLTCIDGDDLAELIRVAHSLKSSSANVGASELAALSEKLEAAAIAGRCAVDLKRDVELLEYAYGTAKAALKVIHDGATR